MHENILSSVDMYRLVYCSVFVEIRESLMRDMCIAWEAGSVVVFFCRRRQNRQNVFVARPSPVCRRRWRLCRRWNV